MKKAFFFDRDGTLIKDKNYLSEISEIEVYKNVFETLKIISNKGYEIFIVTNQSGIGREYYSEKKYLITQEYLEELFFRNGITICETFYSPYYEKSNNPLYLKNKSFRKPSPGMILYAQKKYNLDLMNSFMVGDKLSDIKAGKSAGCKTILLLTGKGKKEIKKIEANSIIRPNYTFYTIKEISKII